MPHINDRLFRLFQHSGLGGCSPAASHVLLNWVDRVQFQHVLRTAPYESLEEPFSTMQRGLSRLKERLPANELAALDLEDRLSALVDRLVREIQVACARSKFTLPYSSADPLWRRIAFATMVLVDEARTGNNEGVIMLNEMVLKVALMVDGPGGLERLERYIVDHGYTPADPDETTLAITRAKVASSSRAAMII